MASHPPASGKSWPPPSVSRRSPTGEPGERESSGYELQLYADLPVSDLPSPLPPPLSRWLARKRCPGRDALWPCLRTSHSSLVPTRGSGSCPVRAVGPLQGYGADLLRKRHLGQHAPTGHSAAGAFHPEWPRPDSSAQEPAADSVHPKVDVGQQLCRLRRCGW